MAKGKQNTVGVCEELAAPVAEQLGLNLWDVRFEKEGSGWFLRYFIDKEGGVDINDCESFSREIDPILDEADPIEQAYCLEVSSPGVERSLTKPKHFLQYTGKMVTARLFTPRGGLREITGELISFQDGVCLIKNQEGEHSVTKGEAATIRPVDDFDYSKEEKG